MNSRVDDRFTAPRAKYGDESVYFDLKDLGNTTGAWDLYGSDSLSPYNGLQVCGCHTYCIVRSLFSSLNLHRVTISEHLLRDIRRPVHEARNPLEAPGRWLRRCSP